LCAGTGSKQAGLAQDTRVPAGEESAVGVVNGRILPPPAPETAEYNGKDC